MERADNGPLQERPDVLYEISVDVTTGILPLDTPEAANKHPSN
jgi:hypothetical protein